MPGFRGKMTADCAGVPRGCVETAPAARIGWLGGSFDPVHSGHLLMAQDAFEMFDLDIVRFLPCDVPPHKRRGRRTPAGHRLAMLEAALAGDGRFAVCDLEIRRGGVSYTVDTLTALRQAYPDGRFFFIIGDDSLIDLPNWRRIDELLRICEFVTLARPGVDLPAGAPGFPAVLRARLLANRRVGHGLKVASSEIRARVAAGHSIRYLVPGVVEDYIESRGLYRQPEE